MNTAIFARPFRAVDQVDATSSGFGTAVKSFLATFRMREASGRLARLITRYEVLPLEITQNEANSHAVELIESVREKACKQVPSNDEIAAVEAALLSMLTGEDLKRYAFWLREDFRNLAGRRNMNAYSISNPPQAEGADEKRLKADLIALHAKLHEIRANRRTQIRARNRIACLTILLSALGIFITLQLDVLLHKPDTIVFDVFGVGMLGGVFSTLIRIHRLKPDGQNATAALTERGNQLTVLLSPVIGGLGAVILFAILSAGLLKGSLLPDLPTIPLGPSADALESVFNVHLASSTEAAKLYVLCFLAGFSERLVPDVISRLASVAKEENSSTTQAGP
jgi:hypothetical protein